MSVQEIVVKKVPDENDTSLYDVFSNGRRIMQSVTYDCFLKYLSNIHEDNDDGY